MMQEFDYTNGLKENEFADIADRLSPNEAAAAMDAVQSLREEQAGQKSQDFKDWFDAAFLPILKNFAALTGSRLKVDQDACHDITASLISQHAIDITSNEKMMHTVITAADHITISTDSSEVELSLIFGFPDDEE